MIVVKMVTTPIKASFRVAKFIGYRRVALLGIGGAIGALVTPVSGSELRSRVRAEITRRRAGTEPSVEDRVRQHLAQSPRTWHLPQPEVVAVRIPESAEWKIILAGEVTDDVSRRDLELASLSVSGVETVDNRLRVDTTTSDS